MNLEGHEELLGLWIGEKEGAKFWLSILAELKNRGVRDILIACVDGPTGFPDAIESEFPKAQIQLCIVHMVRNSLRFVSWKERKVVARDLPAIYTAPTAEAARSELESSDQGLGRRAQPLQHRVRGKDLVVVRRSLTQKN